MSAHLAIGAAAVLAALGVARQRGSRKLEGFERIGTLPRPSEVHPVSRGIYSPRAQEVYAERLKTARLPLYIVLGGGIEPGDKPALQRRAQELADQGYTVLLMANPFEESRSSRSNPRFPEDKDSPITPFGILHRMGDMMRTEKWSSSLTEGLRDVPWHLTRATRGPSGRTATREEMLEFGSTGVNTEAGRRGLLIFTEAMSDLWAKYVLTGKIDFDPEQQPRQGPAWSPDEMKARRQMYEHFHREFPRLLEKARGKVIDIAPA